MNMENIISIIGTGIAVIGGVAAVVKGMLGRIITQMDLQFAELKKDNEAMRREFTDFRLQVVNDYARIPHVEQIERANTASHSTLHGRVDELNNKVIKIETIQGQCKGCQGK
uniref:Uncharacterized protein n=1 Tax=viral metagenome TaxID=1070528 RepID=A0A6M3M3J7_9ZZZZ